MFTSLSSVRVVAPQKNESCVDTEELQLLCSTREAQENSWDPKTNETADNNNDAEQNQSLEAEEVPNGASAEHAMLR